MTVLRSVIPQTERMFPALLYALVIPTLLWIISSWIVGGSFHNLLLGTGVVLALIIAGITINNWRTGVYFFFVWLLFEDMFRKYAGNNMYVYFGKDVLIGVTYLALLLARSRRDLETFGSPFKIALSLFFLLGIAQVFNPNSPSMFYGLLGLKLYFYYIPLMFVGYALIRSESDLHRFLVVNVGLAGVIALIGIIQSIVGLNFLNPRGGQDIDELGHLTRYTASGLAVKRPPSVFVSDGRFALYLVLVFILGFGTAAYLLLRTKHGRKIVFPGLALIGVASVMSGGRGALVYVVASSLLLSAAALWGAPPRGGQGYKLFKAIRRSFIAVALGVFLVVVFFPEEVGARWTFYRESIALDSPNSETVNRAWDYPVGQLLLALSDRQWVIGHGIGTASLGVQYVSRIMGVYPTGLATESGYGIMILELGVLGPILWLIWTASYIIAAYKIVMRVKGTWVFSVAFSIFWFSFLLLFPMTYAGMQAFQNFILNAYLWLLVGILFRLPALVNLEEVENSPAARFSRPAIQPI
jgi:hypothetical protein